MQRDAGAERLEACVQLLDVGAHDGQERGVERGCRGARVLPALRGDLARQGDRHAGKHRFEDASRLPLVLRVREREEKADRDRLDSSAGEGMRCSLDVARLERLEHLTLRADPAARLAAQLARHQRVGFRAPQVVESRALLRPDLDDVAEAGGREQADARGTALDERVRGDRRAVHEVADRRGVNTERVDRGDETGCQVVRLGPDLRDRQPPPPIHADGVRERAADVDADAHAAHRRRTLLPRST